MSAFWLFSWFRMSCLWLDLVIRVALFQFCDTTFSNPHNLLTGYLVICIHSALTIAIHICHWSPVSVFFLKKLNLLWGCALFLVVGVKNDPDLKGVIPNSFDHIFSHIARTENQQFLVRASYLEIYMVRIWLSSCISLAMQSIFHVLDRYGQIWNQY